MALVKCFGQHARNQNAVFERETDAGWGLGSIGQYPPLPIGGTRKVGGIEVQITTVWRLMPMECPLKVGMREKKFRRQQARFEKFLIAVQIFEDHVQQLRPLRQRAGDSIPFLPLNEQGERVELPRAGAIFFADVATVGEVVFLNRPLNLFPASFECLTTDAVQCLNKFLNMGPRLTSIEHVLVIDLFGRRIASQHRIGRGRRSSRHAR